MTACHPLNSEATASLVKTPLRCRSRRPFRARRSRCCSRPEPSWARRSRRSPPGRPLRSRSSWSGWRSARCRSGRCRGGGAAGQPCCSERPSASCPARSRATPILAASFPLFLLACFLNGFHAAVSLTYRFAATDGATDAFRPKAISYVLVAGVASAILGPQAVQHSFDLGPVALCGELPRPGRAGVARPRGRRVLSKPRLLRPPPARRPRARWRCCGGRPTCWPCSAGWWPTRS